jgi:hypothetical protein
MADRDDVLASEVENALAALQNARLESLDRAAALHADLQSALVNEAARIERARSTGDPRAAQLRARLLSNARAAQALEGERQVVGIVVPDPGENGAVVHGRVVDEDGRGIDRLTVRLIDAACAQLEAGGAATDETGAFAIALDQEAVDRVIKSHPQGILLAVSTPRGRVLSTGRTPIVLGHGARLFEEVRVTRADLISGSGPPPSGPPASGQVAVPDVIGMTPPEALAVLKRAGLSSGDPETRVAPDRVGHVIDQRPATGAHVARGSTVTLTVGIERPQRGGASRRRARG